MANTVWGVVKDGLVAPSSPLPEEARVEIHVCVPPPEVPPELQEEFDAWERASAESLDLVDRLADEMERSAADVRTARSSPTGIGSYHSGLTNISEGRATSSAKPPQMDCDPK